MKRKFFIRNKNLFKIHYEKIINIMINNCRKSYLMHDSFISNISQFEFSYKTTIHFEQTYLKYFFLDIIRADGFGIIFDSGDSFYDEF